MIRMKKDLMFGYDKEADVLYVSIGQPKKKMLYVEIGDGQILRVDPGTKKVVGITIVDFSKQFSIKTPFASVPLRASFTPEEEVKELITPSY